MRRTAKKNEKGKKKFLKTFKERKYQKDMGGWADQDDQSYSASDGLDPFEYD